MPSHRGASSDVTARPLMAYGANGASRLKLPPSTQTKDPSGTLNCFQRPYTSPLPAASPPEVHVLRSDVGPFGGKWLHLLAAGRGVAAMGTDSPRCVWNILYLGGISWEILNWIQSRLEPDACWEIRGGRCGWWCVILMQPEDMQRSALGTVIYKSSLFYSNVLHIFKSLWYYLCPGLMWFKYLIHFNALQIHFGVQVWTNNQWVKP